MKKLVMNLATATLLSTGAAYAQEVATEAAPSTATTQVEVKTEAPPPAATTQVEVNTTAPSAPAAPNIKVEMPDINVPAVNTETNTSTHTSTTERIVVDGDTSADNNVLYMSLFGVVAVVLVVIIAMMSRRSDVPTV